MISTKNKHVVPATVAGFVFQFDRMLVNIQNSHPEATIGIEVLDDITIDDNGQITLEQDKISLLEKKNPLANKSKNLWNTLRIWLIEIESNPTVRFRFHFVTNQNIPEQSIVRCISKAQTDADIHECLQKLRSISLSKTEEITKIMQEVQTKSDQLLTKLIKNILLVDTVPIGKEELLQHIPVPQKINGIDLINLLRGWIQDVVIEKWKNREPAIITRQAYTDAYFSACRKLEIERTRELPYGEVLINQEDQDNAKLEPFFQHLLRIGLDDNDEITIDAVDYFLRFQAEFMRLSAAGEILPPAWDAFFDDLIQRWKPIHRRECRTLNDDATDEEQNRIGYTILDETTCKHYKAPLDKQSTSEIYLTSGGYHHLANLDSVWWHPFYNSSPNK
jgi:hypothetical protein